MKSAEAESNRDVSYPHLLRQAAEALGLSDAQRIAYLHRDRWLPYGEVDEVIDTVHRWLSQERKKRPEGLFILARSNNGKSHLLERIANLYPPETAMQGSNIRARVLLLQTPPSGNATSCHSTICSLLNQPMPRTATPREYREAAVDALAAAETQILMWDEMNNLLSGSYSRRKEFLFALKYLSNELRLNLVVAGTPESVGLHRLSDQVESRLKLTPLYAWSLAKLVRFRRLLANHEEVLPLKLPSNLQDKVIAREIASYELRTFGKISDFLNGCAEEAIRTGTEQITMDIVQKLKPNANQALQSMMSKL